MKCRYVLQSMQSESRFTNLDKWRPREYIFILTVLQTQGRQGHKKIASGEGRGGGRTEYK